MPASTPEWAHQPDIAPSRRNTDNRQRIAIDAEPDQPCRPRSHRYLSLRLSRARASEGTADSEGNQTVKPLGAACTQYIRNGVEGSVACGLPLVSLHAPWGAQDVTGLRPAGLASHHFVAGSLVESDPFPKRLGDAVHRRRYNRLWGRPCHVQRSLVDLPGETRRQ
jgi:hypothetical protein